MKKIFLVLIVLIASFSCVASQETKTKSRISISDTTILGIVEGLTEFLPVSSTGHLILTNYALGLDEESVVCENHESLSLKSVADSYAVIIQIGAIFAVVFLYWAYLKSMLLGVLGKDKEGLILFRNLAIAFLPAAIIGYSLYALIEEFLFGIYPVIIALFLGAVVMLFAQKRYDKNAKNKDCIPLSALSIKQSLIIGFMQTVALLPGTSRSMVTILGGYFVGLSPVNSAKFSFLLGLITLSAASIFKIYIGGTQLIEAMPLGVALWGIFVSFIAAIICVKIFVKVLAKWGLSPFAWYRIIFSLVLLGVFWNA